MENLRNPLLRLLEQEMGDNVILRRRYDRVVTNMDAGEIMAANEPDRDLFMRGLDFFVAVRSREDPSLWWVGVTQSRKLNVQPKEARYPSVSFECIVRDREGELHCEKVLYKHTDRTRVAPFFDRLQEALQEAHAAVWGNDPPSLPSVADRIIAVVGGWINKHRPLL